MMPRPPHPVLKAMLVCDLVTREEGTRKVSLIGVTHRISASRFPTTTRTLGVYAALTDALGAYRMRLDLTRLEDPTVTEQVGDLTVVFHDRNSLGEVTFDLSDLVLERPGTYQFRLRSDARVVGIVSLDVVQSLQAGGGP